jgi:hypothetical protein
MVLWADLRKSLTHFSTRIAFGAENRICLTHQNHDGYLELGTTNPTQGTAVG